MSELTSRVLLSSILRSYKALHDLGFAHNDIKPENVVLDGQLHAKLIDFGFTDWRDN